MKKSSKKLLLPDQRLFEWPISAENHGVLTFLCELGPTEYAMTGRDGYELSDRRDEAVTMLHSVRELWRRIDTEGAC